MFAYCGNNPVQHIDATGNDAVLLYDSDFPGHIGALLQDEDGTWWHFYWGAQTGFARFACVLGFDVEALTWCKEYDGRIDLESIKKCGQYAYNYEEMLYLAGDYSKSVYWAQNASGDYNLYTDKCMDKTLLILALSATNLSQTFLDVKRECVLPSKAFRKLKECISNTITTE